MYCPLIWLWPQCQNGPLKRLCNDDLLNKRWVKTSCNWLDILTWYFTIIHIICWGNLFHTCVIFIWTLIFLISYWNEMHRHDTLIRSLKLERSQNVLFNLTNAQKPGTVQYLRSIGRETPNSEHRLMSSPELHTRRQPVVVVVSH